MRSLRQSTARAAMVFLADAADHLTGKEGLTLAVTASKGGGAFASISPSVTERGDGWYALALTASHTDTLGDLALHVEATGADPADVLMQVVLDLPGVAQTGDSYARIGATGSGLTSLAPAATALSTDQWTSPRAAALDALDAAVSTRLAAADYAAPPSAASVAGAVWDEARSGHTTPGTYGDTAEWASGGSGATPAQVWDYLLTSVTTAGSIGELVKTALPAAAPGGSGGLAVADANGNVPADVQRVVGNATFALGLGGMGGTYLSAGFIAAQAVPGSTVSIVDGSAPATIVAAVLSAVLKGTYTLRDLAKDLAAAVGGAVTGGGGTYAVPDAGWGAGDTQMAVTDSSGDRTVTRS